MRLSVVLAAFLVIASVQAGMLLIDSDAPRISITWLQGVERSTVHFANQEVYRYNMTLLAGPNQCFSQGADGNDRAILVEPESDDFGPHRPDAIVDCRICGCEENPNTRYTCQRDGRCAPCDPCSEMSCSSGESCVRESCSQATCTCDPVLCSGSTCDERVSVVSRCDGSDRCVSDRRCIEGACGAECTSDEVTSRTYCSGDTLMREVRSCSSECTDTTRVHVVTDCAERDCPIGTLPRCTDEGCRCV